MIELQRLARGRGNHISAPLMIELHCMISEGEGGGRGGNHKSAPLMIVGYGQRYATNPVCNGTTAETANYPARMRKG